MCVYILCTCIEECEYACVCTCLCVGPCAYGYRGMCAYTYVCRCGFARALACMCGICLHTSCPMSPELEGAGSYFLDSHQDAALAGGDTGDRGLTQLGVQGGENKPCLALSTLPSSLSKSLCLVLNCRHQALCKRFAIPRAQGGYRTGSQKPVHVGPWEA